MASRSLGTLYVDFMARTAGFETDMGRAARIAKKRSKEIDKSIADTTASVNRTAKAIGVGVAAAVGVAAVAIKKAVDEMDQIGKAAQKIGVTTEALSALQYAAKLADVSTQALQSSLTRLARTQADAAQGGKKQLETFRLLGVEFKNADGTLRNADAVFVDVAQRFAEMEDGAGKTALAVQLFGKSGANLVPLLNEGEAGLRAATDEARAFGIIVSGDAAKAADEFGDNLDRLGSAINGVALKAASELADELADLSSKVVGMAKDPAFTQGLADGIRGIGEASIIAAKGVSGLFAAMRDLGESAAAAFNGPAVGDVPRILEELDKAQDDLNFQISRGILRDREATEAARLRVERLTELLRLSREFASVPAPATPPAPSAPTTPGKSPAPVFVDTAAADRAAAEAAREARRQAKEFAEEQNKYTQIVRDLKLQALGDEARAVAALQNQYGDLNKAVELGVISQQEAAEVAAGLAQKWKDTSTQEIRLSLLSDEERAVVELQAEYIKLQNLIQSGAMTQEEGASAAAQMADRWAREQQRARTDEYSSLSSGLLEQGEYGLAPFEQSLRAQEDAINESYSRRTEAILASTLLTEEQQTDLMIRSAEARNAALEDLDTQRSQNQLALWGQAFGNLATLMQSENSKLFNIGKAAAIAEAVVNIAQGITEALSMGPIIGPILAATVAAAGGVQIATIAAQQPRAHDVGGQIGAGTLGLVGERGPELVAGPATVTSRVNTASLLNGMANEDRAPKLRQVIVFGDDQVADALGSDASEQKLITWATRNRTKLRSILA